MYRILSLFAFVCFIFIFHSCTDPLDYDAQTDSCENSFYYPSDVTDTIDVLWSYAYNQNPGKLAEATSFIQGDKLVVFNEFDAMIHVLDRFTGEKIWSQKGNEDYSQIHVVEDQIIASNGGHHTALSIDDGSVLWEFTQEEGRNRTVIQGSTLYNTARLGYCSTVNTGRSFIYSLNLGSGIGASRSGAIFSMPDKDGYESHLHSPAQTILDNGEVLLVFQNVQCCGGPSGFTQKIDLHAYNVTQGKMEWTIDSIAPARESNYHTTPIIEGEHIYFAGGKTLYDIDLLTGTIHWTTPIGRGMKGHSLTLLEDRIIALTYTGRLITWDKITGTQLYNRSYINGTGKPPVVVDDRVYWTHESLFIADAHSGKQIHKLGYPVCYGQALGGPVAVDADDQIMYTADKDYLYGVRMPE